MKTLPLHSLVIANRSQLISKMIVMRKEMVTLKDQDQKCLDLCVEGVVPDVFAQFIEFLYNGVEPTVECSSYRVPKVRNIRTYWADEISDTPPPLKTGTINNKKIKLVEFNFFELFHEYAQHFGVRTSLRENNSQSNIPGQFIFSRDSYPELNDCEIECNDGVCFPSHKCLLASRIPYFQGMLESFWMETLMRVTGGGGDGLPQLKVCFINDLFIPHCKMKANICTYVGPNKRLFVPTHLCTSSYLYLS